PDVAIIDIRLPPGYRDEGLRAAAEVRRRWPGVGVLLLSQYVETAYTAELVEAVRRIGAGGSAIDPEVVRQLVDRARRPDPLDTLSERERAVLALIAEGRSNQAICDRLFLSPKTVES